MRAAMQTGSDAELCAVLQVAREEMPEALKTLQRALERIVEREREEVREENDKTIDASEGKEGGKEKQGFVGLLKRTKTVVSVESGVSRSTGSGSDGRNRDTLDREFIENGIDALRRMSDGLETTSLPSWTITR